MTTYEERRDQLAAQAAVMVQVILGSAPGDMEFVPLAPQPATDEMRAELLARWPGRGLRPVGFIRLVDMEPRLVLKEPLESAQVKALAAAFAVYISTLFRHAITAGSFAAEIERAEVSELQRMYAMPDSRYVN